MKKNFIYNFLLTGSNFLYPLLTFPYLSRVLGAEGLGICNFITSYGQNYLIIAALGIPFYGSREIAKLGDNKARRSKLFFELLTLHLIFTFLLLSIYIATIFIYSDFKNYKNIAFLGGSLILFNVFSFEWLYTGVNNFKYITIRSLIVRGISIFAIFIFVKKKDDFFIYFIVLVCTVFFTVLIDVYYAKMFVSKKISLKLSGVLSHIKPIFLLGVYMVLTSIYSVLPTTLLGFLANKASVGYYYGANKIIRMVITVFSALVGVMVPHLNLVLEEKGKKEYVALINKTLNIVITFGIPITFFVFLMAHPIVLLLAGKSFLNSVLVAQIMSPVILIVAFAQIFVLLILSVHRKDNYLVMLAVCGMVISLLINLVFIRQYAENATAFSQLIAEFAVSLLAYFLAKKVLQIHFPLKDFLLNLLLTIPFAFITYSVTKITDNYLLEIISAAAICGGYFLFCQLFLLKNLFLKSLITPYLLKFKN